MTDATTARNGRELLKALRTPLARFYPCDLHVHSPGSADVCLTDKFKLLPEDLRRKAADEMKNSSYQLPLTREPSDPGHFDESMSQPVIVQAFLDELVARRDEIAKSEGLPESDNWSIVGITDHNTSHFACALSQLAWQSRATNRLLVLPGIELDVCFPLEGVEGKCQIHVLCHFAPQTKASDIRLAISNARSNGGSAWVMGQPIEVANLADFINQLRGATSYPCICVAAHVWSKKGVQNEPTKMILAHLDAQVARLEGELQRAKADGSASEEADIQSRLADAQKKRADSDSVNLSVLRIIGTCGFDALQVRDQSHETHYRRLHRFREQHGRAIPIVSSDAHSPGRVFECASGTPFAKIAASVLVSGSESQVFQELRGRVLRFGETRMTYSKPGSVRYWIEGIEIIRDAAEAKEFWKSALPEVPPDEPFTLALSRNLNCFVGGRGSGKSAGIEAIAFLSNPSEFSTAGTEREPADWYSRAKATLSGCRVRLVWKSTGDTGIGALPKKALLVSRYFDLNGRHDAVELRDADDNAIVDSDVQHPQVRILRVHEIEETARPENLRRLFDDLCGTEIESLNADIDRVKDELARQRTTVSTLVGELAELTVDGSPLRQYGIRKQQFDAVNKPELQERFDGVDKTAAAAKALQVTYEAWEAVDATGTIDGVQQSVKTFLQDAEGRVVRVDESPTTEFATFASLIGGTNEPPAVREQLVNTLDSAKEAATAFGVALFGVKEESEKQHQQRMDELAKAGLPTGSSEREAKKKAYEQAQTAFEAYKAKIASLKDTLRDRDVLHSQLVGFCKSRSDLREARASELSAQLAHDLDGNVLKILVAAKPMADRTELDNWLKANVEPTFSQSKAIRRAALLASGIMPRTIRQILLHEGDPDSAAFQNSHPRVRDGRIDESDAREIVTKCRGRRLVALDERDRWEQEFVDALPEEIREGVVIFANFDGTREWCLDRVLQLDEVVLDDAAEVRLNDRPEDAQSEPRPLDELSEGQRCSAILPILLLSGDYPLVIDQPEENLDNRLIRQVIVNILASMKLRRQVIIATHNPNLPVLGDVEQCVVLQARGRDLSAVVAAGNLDSAEVARYITDIMEGGREAFQYRQSIYQYHWEGAIEVRADGAKH